MKKQVSDFCGFIFTRLSCDQGLKPIVQPISDDGKDQVINAGDTRTGQRLFSKPAQKNIIGDEIDLRNQDGERDGHCHAEDLPVAGLES